MVRRSTAKVAGQPAAKTTKQSTLGKARATVGKVVKTASTLKKAATNIKESVETDIIPEIVDSVNAIKSLKTDEVYVTTAATRSTDGHIISRGSAGLPHPDNIEIRGLDKIAPLLNVDPFDAASFAAAGHVEMSKPEYDATKSMLEGYNRRLETVALGFQVLKNSLKLASSGAEVETEKLNYAVKYQGIETKGIELEIAQSATRQKQSNLDREVQKEQFLTGENVTSGQMLSMKLQKLRLLAQQQSADLQMTRQQTEAMIGGSAQS